VETHLPPLARRCRYSSEPFQPDCVVVIGVADMTLQYRIRSKYEDENWRQRIFHSNEMLLHYLNHWCADSSSVFPVTEMVSRLLLLFSPRCVLHQTNLRALLNLTISTPADEYRATWHNHSDGAAKNLIDSLVQILEDAIKEWESRGFSNLPHADVIDRLVLEIVAHQYVVFHHNQTTRRDLNHWGI
jgi:hypothetical protein